jgi:hypothetical protein
VRYSILHFTPKRSTAFLCSPAAEESPTFCV